MPNPWPQKSMERLVGSLRLSWWLEMSTSVGRGVANNIRPAPWLGSGKMKNKYYQTDGIMKFLEKEKRIAVRLFIKKQTDGKQSGKSSKLPATRLESDTSGRVLPRWSIGRLVSWFGWFVARTMLVQRRRPPGRWRAQHLKAHRRPTARLSVFIF